MNQKKKFGTPHRKYGCSSKLCKKVKKYYDDLLKNPTIPNISIPTRIAKQYKIPRNTAWRWVKRWQKDETYDPSDMTVHGTFNRIFSNKQENDLTEHIIEVYVKTGRYFSDFAFQSLALEFYWKIKSLQLA